MALFDIIKYEGDSSTFIWKHPKEDFNNNSQLIVHENQQAILLVNGQILDIYPSGKYTLKTPNIPIIGAIKNIPSGMTSAFHCEIYFVNILDSMAIKWGTDSRIHFIEPTYNFPLSVGFCGEFIITVKNSKKLLLKLVNTKTELSQNHLTEFFRAFLMINVKSYIAHVIKSQSLSIFEIDEKLFELSNSIKSLLVKDFDEYGISLDKFFITKVLLPNGDENFEKFKTLYFRQYADIAEAKIRQQAQLIDAETDAQKKIINNLSNASPENNVYCDNCGVRLDSDSLFCDNCGTRLLNSSHEEFCTKCGFKFTRPGNFCPKCGSVRCHKEE